MKEELFTEMEDIVLPEEEHELADQGLMHAETPSETIVDNGAATDGPTQKLAEVNGAQESMRLSEPVKLAKDEETFNTKSCVSSLISASSTELQEVTTNGPAPTIEKGATMEDNDWESLISFSEADETREFTMDITAPDSNEEVSLEQPTVTRKMEAEVSDPIMPVDTTSYLDERGEFVPSKITIFEDPIEQEVVPIFRTRGRESLDNQVIFSIPTEKELTGSPPKRPISSLDEQENVHPVTLKISDAI